MWTGRIAFVRSVTAAATSSGSRFAAFGSTSTTSRRPVYDGEDGRDVRVRDGDHLVARADAERTKPEVSAASAADPDRVGGLAVVANLERLFSCTPSVYFPERRTPERGAQVVGDAAPAREVLDRDAGQGGG
jgi:hypothetical protein